MSTTFKNGSGTNSGKSSAKELKVKSRPRSPSPNKNSVSDESASATVRGRSPTKDKSHEVTNPSQSIVDTAQQTVKEAVNYRNLENFLNMFSDEMVKYKSSQDFTAELELDEQKVCSKKVDSAQQRVSRREPSSGKKKLVSNYSRNKMIPASKKRNTDEDISKANDSACKDTVNLNTSDSSVYLNACGTVNTISSIDDINASDDMTQKSKDLKQNNCEKYLKLIDDLCEKIMDESENITLMQVNEILIQLKWKLINYDGKKKKNPVDNDNSNNNNPLNKDSLMNFSSHCAVPIDESSSLLEPADCKKELNVSLELSDTDKKNNSTKIGKSKFPKKDTVKFAGVLKLDTSTWNNRSKQKALLNIGSSKEIKFSNLDVDNNKKFNDKKREKKNEKLSMLRSSKSKTDVKDSEQSVRQKPKVSDEQRLDDRSVEKGLNENRSLSKHRKQPREPCKGAMPCNTRDHKEIISQIKKSFKEYVENTKEKDTKKSAKQIKTKKLSDYQSRSVVKKPVEVHKNKLENITPSYLSCPESKVNILDADGSHAVYNGAFSGENNFKEWVDGKKDIQRDSNTVSKFKEEIIDVDEDKKIRFKSRSAQDTRGSLLRIAQSQSKIKILKHSNFSYTDSLNTPVESLMTAIDLNHGQIKATNSQLLRISLLKAGSKMSNVSIKSDMSTTSFKGIKSLDEFIS